MLVEHARNVIGIGDAGHAESDAGGTPVITLLACSLDGTEITIVPAPGSKLAAMHDGATTVTELTTCNYGLDPARQHIAEEGGMAISAVDGTGEVRAIERVDHPFFVGTLYQPQLRSAPGAPHPLWVAFLRAMAT